MLKTVSKEAEDHIIHLMSQFEDGLTLSCLAVASDDKAESLLSRHVSIGSQAYILAAATAILEYAVEDASQFDNPIAEQVSDLRNAMTSYSEHFPNATAEGGRDE